jgi:hypothetical protein
LKYVEVCLDLAIPALRIDFQERFDKDSVLISVNGKEVFNEDGVTTRLQIGHAGSVDLDVPEDSVEIEITTVPSRRLSGSLAVSTAKTPYLGVSVSRDGNRVGRRSAPGRSCRVVLAAGCAVGEEASCGSAGPRVGTAIKAGKPLIGAVK